MAMTAHQHRIMPVAEPLYSREMLRLATRLAEFPPIEDSVRVERRAPICGSHIALDVVLDGEGRVARIGQKVSACAFGQASAALMALSAKGKTAADLAATRNTLAAYLKGESDEITDWPGLDIFAAARTHSARHGAILLPFEAAAEAVELAIGVNANA